MLNSLHKKRQEILIENIIELLGGIILNSFERLKSQAIEPGQWEKIIVESGILSKEELGENSDEILIEKIKKAITPEKEFEIKVRILSILDSLWMNHLENLADLQESVRIRAYGQHDPLVEYRRESYNMFQSLLVNFEDWIFFNILKIIPQEGDVKIQTQQKVNLDAFKGNVGRNDPCPCGAKKENEQPIKFKHCHGKNL